ncbi:MAG: DUF1697 domain-containing protein [Acidimicrobiia bacterium]|nr:DUF1697 domain-containing protein [Acidimicrobiia bacterium]
MDKYVAFLRAINVGNRRVKMADLADHIAAIGYTEVNTHIASGNVIVTADDTTPEEVEDTLETVLEDQLGFEVPTFVRSAEAVRAIVSTAPDLDVSSDDVFAVGFLKVAPAAVAIEDLLNAVPDNQAAAVTGREVWWRRVRGDARGFNFDVEGLLGQQTTFRNISTVETIVEKYLD